MTEPEKRITVRVPESLHRKAKARAALVGRSLSDVVREYLEQWTSDIQSLSIIESEDTSEKE